MNKKTIGIVGGMGPLATAELFKMIVENTKSDNDYGHIRIIIDNNPQIPDRTNAIVNNGESPVPYILKSIDGLKSLGADIILLPCNTSHFFFDEIVELANIEIVNMIEETALTLNRAGVLKVGVLSTTGTLVGGVYKRYLDKYGIEAIYPTENEQNEIMRVIYRGVKAGNKGYIGTKFQKIIDRMYDEKVQTIILGCTELIIGVKNYGIKIDRYIDPMYVLANAAICKAGYDLKEDNICGEI